MITKERLKELIKEEKDCYVIFTSLVLGCIHLNKKYEPRIEVKEDGYSLWVFTSNRFDFKNCIDDCELFETKEEAEWELEFGNITRTETLKLANYTNFENENGDRVFYHKGTTYELSLWWASDNTKIIRITWKSKDGFGWIFEKPLTKENYIEACQLCKKLFLNGEAV